MEANSMTSGRGLLSWMPKFGASRRIRAEPWEGTIPLVHALILLIAKKYKRSACLITGYAAERPLPMICPRRLSWRDQNIEGTDGSPGHLRFPVLGVYAMGGKKYYYLPANFGEQVAECLAKGYKFIFIPFVTARDGQNGGHMTLIVLNTHKQTAEHIDPNGVTGLTHAVFPEVNQLIGQATGWQNFRMTDPSLACPNIGPQAGTGDTCVAWTMLLLETQVNNPDKTLLEIQAEFMQRGSKQTFEAAMAERRGIIEAYGRRLREQVRRADWGRYEHVAEALAQFAQFEGTRRRACKRGTCQVFRFPVPPQT